jgi:hypothetical protein
MATDIGYVNYYEVLGLQPEAKPGEVRKIYRRKMKELVDEIRRVEITEELRSNFLLNMAKFNAALIILRDLEGRQVYWTERTELIALEERYCAAAESNSDEVDELRREYDRRLKSFLSNYVEEKMLAAGGDKECAEISHWDAAHARHASRILRHYRNGLYQTILERLPFTEVTTPAIKWDERRRTAAGLLKAGGE